MMNLTDYYPSNSFELRNKEAEAAAEVVSVHNIHYAFRPFTLSKCLCIIKT